MKVKVFDGIARFLEPVIEKWLATNNISIISVTQSESVISSKPGSIEPEPHVTLTIFYFARKSFKEILE